MKIEKANLDGVYSPKFINKSMLQLPFLPTNISVVACDFYLAHFNPMLFHELNISFPNAIQNSVLKRQAEYLAGRFAASCALGDLGVMVNDIGIGTHRSPVWPNGISASITHTNDKAVCAAADNNDYQYLGIDLENILSKKSIIEIKNIIINNNENNMLKKSDLSIEEAFTLIFSAKESLFKALYPSVGYYFDFTVVEVIEIKRNENSFKINLLKNLTPELKAGRVFKGYFCFDETSIFSIIAQ